MKFCFTLHKLIFQTRIISVVDNDVHEVEDEDSLDDDVFNIITEPTCSTSNGSTDSKDNKKRRCS
ncbi:hypothetical protein ACF0H5_010179 [Mactra antiquata]